MRRHVCVHTVCEHVCLCLTHLRNSRGLWVQANLKTEQARKAGRKISRGRSYTRRVKEGGPSKHVQPNLKKKETHKKGKDEVGLRILRKDSNETRRKMQKYRLQGG